MAGEQPLGGLRVVAPHGPTCAGDQVHVDDVREGTPVDRRSVLLGEEVHDDPAPGAPGDPFAGMGSPNDEAASLLGGDVVWTFGLGVLALVAIHAVSFWRDWIRSDLRRTATPAEEMARPYGRLIVLHVTILLGAFGLASVGAPAWTMLLLCVGKTVIELAAAAGKTWFATKPVDQST